MRTRLLPPTLALAAVAGLAAPAAAGAAWSAPQTLVRPAAAQLAAVGAQNAAVFVWTVTSKRLIRTRAGSRTFATYVRARIRLPGGRLRTTRAISSTTELVSDPAVALDAGDNATAVWTQAGRHVRIMVSFRPRGGQFGPPVEIGRTNAFATARPQIAVASLGGATIAWNGGQAIHVVRRPAGRCAAGRPRACFGTPQRFSPGADQVVATTAGGRGYVVWAAKTRVRGEARTRLRIAVAAPGRRFERSQAITTNGDASQPAIALLTHERAVVAWRGSPPAGGEQDTDATIFATQRDRAGAIAPPQAVSVLPGSDPQLATNVQGEAILAWNQRRSTPQNPDGPEVAAAVRPATGDAFGSPVTLSPPDVAAGSISIAVDAGGTAALVYSAAAGLSAVREGPVAVSVQRAPGAAGFGNPQLLPAEFTGAFVFNAGTPIMAASGGSGGRTLLSNLVP